MTTAIQFPALRPTSRTYTPGTFPTKRFVSVSGAGTTRIYGSKSSEARLQLQFVLGDEDVRLLVDCWHDAKGDYTPLALSSSVFTGVGEDLLGGIPTYLNWRWAEPPSVESLFPGRSRVTVNLLATLDL